MSYDRCCRTGPGPLIFLLGLVFAAYLFEWLQNHWLRVLIYLIVAVIVAFTTLAVYVSVENRRMGDGDGTR